MLSATRHLLAIAIFLNTALVVVETLLYCIATVSSICFWLTAFVTVFVGEIMCKWLQPSL